MASPSRSLVSEPAANHIEVLENHDGAYYLWQQARVRNKVLVHIDAHHDMWWVKEKGKKLVTIANFICPALKEDLVREVFWVVPDATWRSTWTRWPVSRHMKAIAAGYSEYAPSRVTGMKAGRLTANLLGKPVSVCPLSLLPSLEEDVLLDIDTDYLVIPRVNYGQGERDDHAGMPWRWPAELIDLIRAMRIRSTLRTVVYSVEGSYTPLKWKYLGDELAARLNEEDDRQLRGFEEINEGTRAEAAGKLELALDRYRRAADLLPDSAAPWFRLALLYADAGKPEEGQVCYGQAIQRDPSYRTPYSSQGFHYDWKQQPREAEREHRRMLAIDAENPFACLGMARLAKRKNDWPTAEHWLRRCLSSDSSFIDAHRELGYVLERERRYPEAIEAYERSMKLALAGGKTLGNVILSHPEEHGFLDPAHSYMHATLARLYERVGASKKSVTGYRMSIASAYDTPEIRFRLARLYLRQKQTKKARTEALIGIKNIPGAGWSLLRRSSWRLARLLRRTFSN